MTRTHLILVAATFLATLAVGIPVASLADTTTSPSAVVAAVAPTQPKPKPTPPGGGALERMSLRSLDGATRIDAYFNPKEVRITKAVPWTKSKTSTGDKPELEFSSAEGRTMSFELLFDGFEDQVNVETTYVSKLYALASIIDPNGSEDKKRPPRVRFDWGQGLVFDGVIASLDVKYTQFLPNGTPVKATAAIKLLEASRASFKRPK